ncbi:MAG: type II toxin-antitoxin system PrlF family antitoxin [Desulfobacterales bacterium]|nr:type II toxin-antitoxin system PrlF family antitoxin [Desulfobacterales bacterium]
MNSATVTSKGQVTIPKSVRQALGLYPGDRIEFLIHENGEITLQPIKKRADEVYGMLRKPGRKPVSVEDMNEAVRKRFRKQGIK